MGDVACALKDIHRKNYIHADLKPDNILVTRDFVAKVSDFGIVKNKNVDDDDGMGSVRYMPADFFSGTYDKSVDIYSFGLVVYQFFTGEKHEIDQDTKQPVLGKLDTINIEQIRDIIAKCTKSEPSERAPAEIYHCLLRNWYDTFMKILEYSDSVLKYKMLATSEKNRFFMHFNDVVIQACMKKITYEALFKRLGVTRNAIHIPNVEDMLTKLALLSLKQKE